MRAEGYLCAITERWNQYAKVRQDLFGFIDVICVKNDVVVAVQTTSGDHVAERIKKIRETPASDVWLQSPSRKIVVHGWKKRGAKGETKHWTCRIIEVLTAGEREL